MVCFGGGGGGGGRSASGGRWESASSRRPCGAAVGTPAVWEASVTPDGAPVRFFGSVSSSPVPTVDSWRPDRAASGTSYCPRHFVCTAASILPAFLVNQASMRPV